MMTQVHHDSLIGNYLRNLRWSLILLFLALQRHYLEGLVQGGVKD